MSLALIHSNRESSAAFTRGCDFCLSRLDIVRRELSEILASKETWFVQVPRGHIVVLLNWFDDVENEQCGAHDFRAMIGVRVEALIACLDALDPDSDFEDECDDDGDREPEDMVF